MLGKRKRAYAVGASAFTVIEMLVVISVISILAGILLPAIHTAQKKAKIAKTQAMIDSINIALKQYRTDFGAYPPADIPGVTGETSAECVYYYTAANFIAGTATNSLEISAGPYMEFRQKDKKSTARTADMLGDGTANDTLFQVIDSWGNPLIYTKPGTNNPSSFDLYSFGPNGTAGGSPTDDDIKNW